MSQARSVRRAVDMALASAVPTSRVPLWAIPNTMTARIAKDMIAASTFSRVVTSNGSSIGSSWLYNISRWVWLRRMSIGAPNHTADERASRVAVHWLPCYLRSGSQFRLRSGRLAQNIGNAPGAIEIRALADLNFAWSHACVRPRRPHNHAVGPSALPRRDAQLRRHRTLHFSARRGRHR